MPTRRTRRARSKSWPARSRCSRRASCSNVPGRCEFPTRGPSRYFGGDDALAAKIRAGVAAALGPDGDDVRVGIADGVFVARLAARRSVVVPAGGSAEYVAPWPVSVLDDDELASLLVRLGLPTLGAVAALAPDAVLARFGSEGRRIHELARGIDPGPSVLVAPPPDLVERTELDPPAERVDVAAFAAKELADRLLERLAERGLACTRVLVEAETEHGERLTRCWRHARSELGDALTAGVLAERVRWQLDAWINTGETTAGITSLALIPDEVVPGRRSPARVLGWRPGRAPTGRSRARPRPGHARLRRGDHRGRAGWAHARPSRCAGFRGASRANRSVRSWSAPRSRRGRARSRRRSRRACSIRRSRPSSSMPRGDAIAVNGRGEQLRPPAHVRCRALPAGGGRGARVGGPVGATTCGGGTRARAGAAPAGNWSSTRCGRAHVACVVVVEGGRAGVEAIYD